MAAGLAAVGALPSLAAAVLATRPHLAARVFGGSTNPARHPSEVGLVASEVDAALGWTGWWVPAEDPVAAVVVVHGFEPSDDPKATDTGPRIEMAKFLVDANYSVLLIGLGYGSGAHPHTGGAAEADDIADAVAWTASTSQLRVALLGLSAGGHAAIAASGRSDVVAVVTDSSFVSFGDIVAEQASGVLGLPVSVFAGVPHVMRAMTGHYPVELDDCVIGAVPMLHIHGDADTAIDHTNLSRLAAITGGATLTVAGAEHIDSFRVDPDRYRNRVLEFLDEALG